MLEPLGEGGFGSVYLGRLIGQSGFTKTVAVKLLHDQDTDQPELEHRLRDEARLLARLRHRAIVHVDDLVQIDGRWAVVMEYVEGADLLALLGGGPIPPRAACGLVMEVAGALRAAHTAVDDETGRPMEIVHRDIKPANIRVTPGGTVKVLDFGVARARFDAREAETQSITFGSLGYMAPERLEGLDTPASDVYSLGSVLFECLSGQALGRLSIHPRRYREALELATDALELNPALTELLRSMLAYDRFSRPDAAECERALRDLQGALPGPWFQEWAEGAVSGFWMEVATTDGGDDQTGETAAAAEVVDTLSRAAARRSRRGSIPLPPAASELAERDVAPPVTTVAMSRADAPTEAPGEGPPQTSPAATRQLRAYQDAAALSPPPELPRGGPTAALERPRPSRRTALAVLGVGGALLALLVGGGVAAWHLAGGDDDGLTAASDDDGDRGKPRSNKKTAGKKSGR